MYIDKTTFETDSAIDGLVQNISTQAAPNLGRAMTGPLWDGVDEVVVVKPMWFQRFRRG